MEKRMNLNLSEVAAMR